MKKHRADTPASESTQPLATHRRRDFGAGVGLLVAAAVLVVALTLGLFIWSTAQKQTASGDNAAPSLTTGSATSTPNKTGVTPPPSR